MKWSGAGQMDLRLKGKKILIRIITLILLIDVTTIAINLLVFAMNGNIGDATQETVTGLIRLLLEVGISYNLYKGHNWAKWVLVVLLSLGGLLSLFLALVTFSILMLLLGIAYIAISVTLIASKPVKEFMRYQEVGDIPSYDNSIDNENEPFYKPEIDD